MQKITKILNGEVKLNEDIDDGDDPKNMPIPSIDPKAFEFKERILQLISMAEKMHQQVTDGEEIDKKKLSLMDRIYDDISELSRLLDDKEQKEIKAKDDAFKKAEDEIDLM